MKNLFNLVMLVLLVSGLTSCSVESVNADEVGVFTEKPWFIGSGGVDGTPLLQGSEMVSFSTDITTMKSTPLAYKEPFTDLFSSDRYPIDFDATLTLQIDKTKAPILLSNFGMDWYNNNVRPEYRRMVRSIASKHTMYALVNNESTDTIEATIKEQLIAYVKETKLPVFVLNVSLGKASPPAEVLVETQRTASQNQNLLTQQARAKAEEQRKNAEHMKGLADLEYKTTMNFTPEQYLRLREIENDHSMIDAALTNRNVQLNYIPRGSLPTMPLR